MYDDVSAGHAWHFARPASGWYVPAAQFVHVDCIACGLYVPAGHAVWQRGLAARRGLVRQGPRLGRRVHVVHLLLARPCGMLCSLDVAKVIVGCCSLCRIRVRIGARSLLGSLNASFFARWCGCEDEMKKWHAPGALAKVHGTQLTSVDVIGAPLRAGAAGSRPREPRRGPPRGRAAAARRPGPAGGRSAFTPALWAREKGGEIQRLSPALGGLAEALRGVRAPCLVHLLDTS